MHCDLDMYIPLSSLKASSGGGDDRRHMTAEKIGLDALEEFWLIPFGTVPMHAHTYVVIANPMIRHF